MSVYFVLVTQQLIAGGTHIIAKAIVQDIEPATLTLLRSVLTAVLLVIAFLVRKIQWKIERRDYLNLVWVSLLAVPVNQFLFFYGISRTTASNAALLYATTPVVVLVLSRLILKESLTWKKVVGVIIALIGVTSVIFEDGFEMNSSHTYGNLLLVAAVFAWSLFTISGKPLIERYGAFYVTSLVLIIGMVLYLPIGLLFGNRISLLSLSTSDWEGLVCFSIGTSFLGYFLWYYALGRMEASKVAIFSNAQPFLTTLLAVVFLSQSVSTSFILGGLVTISGVTLAQFR
jgi:drug/metabolite transporter (DMT)-like permease